jgi:hypothetical protein
VITGSAAARFLDVVTAAFLGAGSSLLFFDAAFSGPEWAPCLGPALFGLVQGLVVGHWRIRGARHGGRKRGLPLQIKAFAACLAFVTLVCAVEQRVAVGAWGGAFFTARAALLSAVIASLASLLGKVVFRDSAAPAPIGAEVQH